jgi:aminopeptidase
MVSSVFGFAEQRSVSGENERLEKLARLLVEYSIGAGEGEQVVVSGGVAAEPLIKEVYRSILDVGAVPIPQVQLPGMQEVFFRHAKPSHYERTPPVIRAMYENADALSPSWPRATRRPSPRWTRRSSRPWASGTRRSRISSSPKTAGR